uniref:Lon N-terminal domain-containing protein n=1 Tax=Phaeomonas parva TaxID=124430 RepID=A0A7S1UKG0_9STRA|mmetsp:Transcript_6447/g.18249  ORF Transcript_6447/g.18249 Transcript_6447/m.18249 type:complete len:451 (+) Transcript_6447:196-1548(+)
MRLFRASLATVAVCLFPLLSQSLVAPRRAARGVARRMQLRASTDINNIDDAKAQIRWLPPLNPSVKEASSSGIPNTTVMPVFPLGSIAYCPESEQVLNIFEPRYRKMYNDILMNGSRRFCVTMVSNEQAGQFAEVGVVFYLKDLREVSEQTGDAVKYICTHDVVERVKIHTILNPRAGVDRSTYMKAEVSILTDDDKDAELDAAQAALMEKVEKVVGLQDELGEDVRFEVGVAERFDGGRNGDKSLWSLIELWKAYLGTRMQSKSNQMQREVEEILVTYLQKRADNPKGKAMRSGSFSLADLPLSVRKNVQGMQERLRGEVMPMLDEQTIWVQLILQAATHEERLAIFEKLVDNETQRIQTRLSLKKMFGSVDAPSIGGEPKDEPGFDGPGPVMGMGQPGVLDEPPVADEPEAPVAPEASAAPVAEENEAADEPGLDEQGLDEPEPKSGP